MAWGLPFLSGCGVVFKSKKPKSQLTTLNQDLEGTTVGNAATSGTNVDLHILGFRSWGKRLELSLCLVEIKLIQKDSLGEKETIRLKFEDVILTERGANLGNVAIPKGTYTGLVLKIEDDCDRDASALLTNINGSFSTDRDIRIRFEGHFEISDLIEDVLLQMQSLVPLLLRVSSDEGIKSVLEGRRGVIRSLEH